MADALNLPFTLSELQAATARLKPKSTPGPDGCTNQALRNTPAPLRAALLVWFNRIWLTAWVVPIPKPGKPAADLGSYRPISLISCTAKLFEKLVQGRLLWFLESQNLLPPSMLGFREHLCAQDAVLEITTHLKWSRGQRHHTVAVLDLSKAFDSVNVQSVLGVLGDMGLQGNVLCFLERYLLCRPIAAKLNGTISAERRLEKGLPQGSGFSPLLLNCAITKIVKSVPRNVTASFFADDICIWGTRVHIRPLLAVLQEALNALSGTTKELCLT